MYRNLNAEMARRNMTKLGLARATGIPYSTLIPKLSGETEIKLSEAKSIKEALGTDIPLETLFEVTDDEDGPED